MIPIAESAHSDHVVQRSLERMRELLDQGEFSDFSAVDSKTGRLLNPEALALFSTLPSFTPASHPNEAVEKWLLRSLPKGLQKGRSLPRYRQGREVFVRTRVQRRSDSPRRSVGTYDESCPERVTHLGQLMAADGDDFLVAVQGHQQWLRFPRSHIFKWNQPTGAPSIGGHLSGVQIDYRDPRMKAYICAAFLELGADIEALDFTLSLQDIEKQQRGLIHRLASRINMSYAGESDGYSGNRAGGLIDGGQGVCFVQRAVGASFLQAFSQILNFETQVAVGRTLRLDASHGFVVVTLFPSMRRFVSDPAWSEPLTDLRIAFFGPNWGHDRCLEHLEGEQELEVEESTIELPPMEEGE